MKKQVEFFDTDFLDNKIEIGDKVIIEEPKYRNFIIGTVVTKAPKSCQIEYVDFVGDKKVARQYYDQIIKYPLAKEGEWIKHVEKPDWLEDDVEVYYECSCCGINNFDESPYCPKCGARTSSEYTEEAAANNWNKRA